MKSAGFSTVLVGFTVGLETTGAFGATGVVVLARDSALFSAIFLLSNHEVGS